MDGQTDRCCPCCREEEEGELKCQSHLDLRNRPQPGPATREQQQDCACGPDSLAGGHFPAPGVSVLHLHPHRASPVFLMDKVTLSVSLPLPGALHGTDQLSILPSTSWSGIMRVDCLVLAGFHPKELPQEVFPTGSAWIWGEGWLEGQGEQAGAVQAPCTGVVLVEDCHKHIHRCCLQFSHAAGEDVEGMLLLKAGELCWFQGRVNFPHRKYSSIQATVKKN